MHFLNLTVSINSFSPLMRIHMELVSITSNQPDNAVGSGNTSNDIQDAAYGTPDTNFSVRAERSGSGDRIYTVTYKATDNAGNTTVKSENIVVKHDNSQK
ncbi:hypothetical protein [Neobacillus ginsengisoli]|uniref:Pesticidal crystal protein Cry22Aa Ig-like domain-containing protein n=1 Tax=Neobacillus ginsengisoli TaxID=904295 RepID=A0ABT9Y1I5_9BACI|nr:hypothetical protein [Neobacillus ginsengisoli]MDQ0201693.1 hypothetical protein [Neobacillus ginsengisoli]